MTHSNKRKNYNNCNRQGYRHSSSSNNNNCSYLRQ